MKIVAVTQSNYIPWKGYFDIINVCDEVIFLDDVQYTRRDWRNRNKIKTPQEPKWLTIPVDVKGKYADLRICDVTVGNHDWAQKHWDMIAQNYKKAPFFKEIETLLKPVYAQAGAMDKLTDINFLLITTIAKFLGVETKFSKSYDYYSLEELDAFSSTTRLLKLCQSAAATDYLSGPAAQAYMETSEFADVDINVHWANYDSYTEYEQQYGAFTHFISIIDLLMMEGKGALDKMIGKAILS